MADELRISYSELKDTFRQVLLKNGFDDERAMFCAEVFADNSLDGVYTHGVNRFPRFAISAAEGQIIPQNSPVRLGGIGGMEQWDAKLGPGPLNAIACTDRVMTLADENGIGCVALSNSNHWMRGGNYGWRAAKKGYAFICWTNTMGNMPGWGAKDSHLGNNPIIMAIPKDDEAIVLDMAISQYSYGTIEKVAKQNKKLDLPGGFDKDGNITNDAQLIWDSHRSLPIGYWKGSGLSLLLDILATVLSGGKAAFQISKDISKEIAMSQVFIAIKLSTLNNAFSINTIINAIIDDYHSAEPDGSGNKILYPGERVLQTREENTEKGIPVDSGVWAQVLALLN